MNRDEAVRMFWSITAAVTLTGLVMLPIVASIYDVCR